ncbi:hypothetical protein JCGZ_10756 [Jatropha curcas]|uniref:Pentacotripeptide-repeat region of PRORP domain-containing protein n=2 Tax=Jatropha curcas TaxID=180498 RepID=A0A067LQZ7_JATCU|nr:hypothetical protein JCGZ_10756 [Jatropha curcas]
MISPPLVNSSVKTAIPFPKFLSKSKPKSFELEGRLILTVNARGRQDKPLQKGRNVSIEAIQSVQALKRAYYNDNNNNNKNSSTNDGDSLRHVFRSKFSRLLKLDMLAVLRELLRQNHCLLALQVFEDIRKEYWYKPQPSLYNDMIKVMASNGHLEQVQLLCAYLKSENNLVVETEAFGALLTTLVSFNLTRLAMECYDFMKAVGYEPDRSTFRTLINGLESIGESSASAILRQDAQKYYGESLEFLLEDEAEDEMTVRWRLNG